VVASNNAGEMVDVDVNDVPISITIPTYQLPVAVEHSVFVVCSQIKTFDFLPTFFIHVKNISY
jgi:hypothetical protein